MSQINLKYIYINNFIAFKTFQLLISNELEHSNYNYQLREILLLKIYFRILNNKLKQNNIVTCLTLHGLFVGTKNNSTL